MPTDSISFHARLTPQRLAARDLLLAYHRRLQRRAARLVLSATCPRVREAFADVAPEYRPELLVEARA